MTDLVRAKHLSGDLQTDVLIVGAGTAGIPAAIAAARAGAKVVLIEGDPTHDLRRSGATSERGRRPCVDGGILTGLSLGERRIRAQIALDATGTGEIAVRAGCRAIFGRQAQAEFGEPHAPHAANVGGPSGSAHCASCSRGSH